MKAGMISPNCTHQLNLTGLLQNRYVLQLKPPQPWTSRLGSARLMISFGLLVLMTPEAWSWAVLSVLNPDFLSISCECSSKTRLHLEGTEAGVIEGNETGSGCHHLLILDKRGVLLILQELRNIIKWQNRGYTFIQLWGDLARFCFRLLREYDCIECLQPQLVWWSQLLGKFWRIKTKSFQTLLIHGASKASTAMNFPLGIR